MEKLFSYGAAHVEFNKWLLWLLLNLMQRGSFVIYFILIFFTEDPNVFIIPSKDVFQVKLGALWNVTCKATGNPMPFVHWRKEKTQEDVTPKRRTPEVVLKGRDSESNTTTRRRGRRKNHERRERCDISFLCLLRWLRN